MNKDIFTTELDEQDKGCGPLQFVCLDLASQLLPEAILGTCDPVQDAIAQKRALDIAQGRRDFYLYKPEGVEEHVFSDGHTQIIPITSQPSKSEVNAWAGRTLRRGPIHYHDEDNHHITRQKRPVIDPDPDQVEVLEDEDGWGDIGHNPLMQKIPRPAKLNTLDMARKRAASYRSRRHS